MGSYKAGKAVEVQFKDFAPDLPLDTPGILLDTQGVYPTVKGYQLLNQPAPVVAHPLPEVPVGATIATYSDGTAQYWAGGMNHLYRMSGTENTPGSSWGFADSLGGGNSFAADKWRFAQFNDDLIAVGGGWGCASSRDRLSRRIPQPRRLTADWGISRNRSE